MTQVDKASPIKLLGRAAGPASCVPVSFLFYVFLYLKFHVASPESQLML